MIHACSWTHESYYRQESLLLEGDGFLLPPLWIDEGCLTS
jgi:hypothetical protein